MKVYVKYNRETLEVDAFLLENQILEKSDYIEIDKEKEKELMELANENCGTLFVKDVEQKIFESRLVIIGG